MTDTTYTTPLDRAKSLRDDLIAFATARSYSLPSTRYVQVGEIVRDCESVIVSVNSLTPDVSYGPIECVSPRQATFLVDVVRACAIVYDQNSGITIPNILESVSEVASSDGQLLYDFASDTYGWTSKQWSIAWSLAEGGLSVSSLQIVMGIP